MTTETTQTTPQTVVTFSSEFGANVRILDLPTDAVEEEGLEHAAFEALEEEGGGTPDCIMNVEDARAAALYILQLTGGLPPVKAALDALNHARYLLSEIRAGNAYSEMVLTQQLDKITTALNNARNVGRF